jgi:hypothetical protein
LVGRGSASDASANQPNLFLACTLSDASLFRLSLSTTLGKNGDTDMGNSHGRFVWYELMTTDMKAAKLFYANVVGWGARDASAPALGYSLFTVADLPSPG